MNRIKEVLEEKGIKQACLAQKARKRLEHCLCICMQPQSTKPRNALPNSGDTGSGREDFNWKANGKSVLSINNKKL